MKTELTNEEKAIIPIIRDKWLSYLQTESTDAQIITAYQTLYELAGFEKPTVIFMDSPFAAQIAANNLQSATQIRSQIDDQIYDHIYGPIYGQVHAPIRSQINTQIGSQINGKINNQIIAPIRKQINTQIHNYVFWGYYGDWTDWGWIANFDYYYRINILNHAKFNQLNAIAPYFQAFTIQFEHICIVSRKPTRLERDSNYKLHGTVRFADGWGGRYEHGEFIEPTKLYLQEMHDYLDPSQKPEEIKWKHMLVGDVLL